MCLEIRKIKHSYKYEIVNGEKLIPVWKVITEDDYSIFPELLGAASHAIFHIWNIGWNYAKVNSLKDGHEYTDTGFHFLLSQRKICSTLMSLELS